MSFLPVAILPDTSIDTVTRLTNQDAEYLHSISTSLDEYESTSGQLYWAQDLLGDRQIVVRSEGTGIPVEQCIRPNEGVDTLHPALLSMTVELRDKPFSLNTNLRDANHRLMDHVSCYVYRTEVTPTSRLKSVSAFINVSKLFAMINDESKHLKKQPRIPTELALQHQLFYKPGDNAYKFQTLTRQMFPSSSGVRRRPSLYFYEAPETLCGRMRSIICPLPVYDISRSLVPHEKYNECLSFTEAEVYFNLESSPMGLYGILRCIKVVNLP
ncbi:hypothetical protein BJ165DRAFT_1534502 [Panaeolus papilionaceus]|nr:hypothetical protein BJ165DRAFT_1534502 [Panaeolus papilionaceus]